MRCRFPFHWSFAFQMSLSPEAVATLSNVSTGTITTVMVNKGLRNVWMRGTKPLRPGQPRLVGCGGVAVFPNDIIVADQDGAVVIPQALLDYVLAEGPEQERREAWIVNEVNNGAVLPGLYPMNAETKARYEASKK